MTQILANPKKFKYNLTLPLFQLGELIRGEFFSIKSIKPVQFSWLSMPHRQDVWDLAGGPRAWNDTKGRGAVGGDGDK